MRLFIYFSLLVFLIAGCTTEIKTQEVHVIKAPLFRYIELEDQKFELSCLVRNSTTYFEERQKINFSFQKGYGYDTYVTEFMSMIVIFPSFIVEFVNIKSDEKVLECYDFYFHKVNYTIIENNYRYNNLCKLPFSCLLVEEKQSDYYYNCKLDVVKNCFAGENKYG